MTLILNGTTGISGVDGTAATPAFKGNDSNTGVSFGTDIVTINTGGQARVTTDASGNVGVGTASPSSFGRFAVQTDGGTGVAIVGYSPSTTNGARLVLADNYSSAEVRSVPVAATLSSDMLFRTGNADRLRLDSSGNLGLGVTPSAWAVVKPLEIGSAGNAFSGFINDTGIYATSNAYYNSGWKYAVSSKASTRYSAEAGAHSWSIAPSGTAGDAISFTQAMTLDASGNLAIGHTSAGAKLDVQGASADQIRLRTAGTEDYRIGRNSSDGYLEFYGSQSGFVGYKFNGVNGERARIDSSGNLLVGTLSQFASAKLSVGGSIASGTGWYTRAGSSGAIGSNLFNIQWTGSPVLWIDSTNVGTLATTSDYRIKKNITTQTTPALKRVMQLRPVNYELQDYKTLFQADGVTREGFIAHELAEVIPSAVDGEKDAEDQIQSLRLDALCSVLTKAIQEQQAIITQLQADVAALKGAA